MLIFTLVLAFAVLFTAFSDKNWKLGAVILAFGILGLSYSDSNAQTMEQRINMLPPEVLFAMKTAAIVEQKQNIQNYLNHHPEFNKSQVANVNAKLKALDVKLQALNKPEEYVIDNKKKFCATDEITGKQECTSQSQLYIETFNKNKNNTHLNAKDYEQFIKQMIVREFNVMVSLADVAQKIKQNPNMSQGQIIIITQQATALKLEADAINKMLDETLISSINKKQEEINKARAYNDPKASDLRMRDADGVYDIDKVTTEYKNKVGDMSNNNLNRLGIQLMYDNNVELAKVLFLITYNNNSLDGAIYSKILDACNEPDCLIEQRRFLDIFGSFFIPSALNTAYKEKQEAYNNLTFKQIWSTKVPRLSPFEINQLRTTLKN